MSKIDTNQLKVGDKFTSNTTGTPYILACFTSPISDYAGYVWFMLVNMETGHNWHAPENKIELVFGHNVERFSKL